MTIHESRSDTHELGVGAHKLRVDTHSNENKTVSVVHCQLTVYTIADRGSDPADGPHAPLAHSRPMRRCSEVRACFPPLIAHRQELALVPARAGRRREVDGVLLLSETE